MTSQKRISSDGPDYQVQVLRDFTAGLYERGNDRECPPNGLLEATDCYPLPYGGIRAGPKFQPLSQVGLTLGGNSSGGSIPMGIFAMAGMTAGQSYFLSELQIDQGGAGNHTLKMQNLAGESTASMSTGAWSPVFTSSGITQYQAGQRVATLRVGSGSTFAYKMYFDLTAVPQAKSGIYNFTTAGSSMQFAAAGPHGLISAQQRLMYIAHETTVYGVPNQIQFTDVSTDAAPSTSLNFRSPLVERSLPLQWINPTAPSDIIGLKLGASVFSIQGDISASPTVRELTFDHNVSDMYPAPTDIGLVYQATGQGIYAYNQGLSAEQLSRPILGDPFSSPELSDNPHWTGINYNYRGSLAFGDGFLYAGRYMYDTRTKAWFKLSGMNYGTGTTAPNVGGMPAWATIDVSNHRVLMANYGRFFSTGPQVLWWNPENETDWIRSSGYAVTFPLIDLEQRQVDLRRLEIFGSAFGTGGTWTVTLTNQAGTVTPAPAVATLSSGAVSAAFNMHGHGDWIKIRVQSAGTGAGTEAPMIERVALYYQSRQSRVRS